MSIGIAEAARPPRTASASDITVTAMGFRSEKRIRPFMRDAPSIERRDDVRTRSAGGLDRHGHAVLERSRRAEHDLVVRGEARVDLDQGAVVGPELDLHAVDLVTTDDLDHPLPLARAL